MDLDKELAMLIEVTEAEALKPSSLTEAKCCLDWPDQEQALAEKLTTVHEAGTWEIIEPPSGVNIIGSKWVFRDKKDTDGNIACKKARLITQGFSQILGINYFNTYALVVCLSSIQTILALVA